MPLSISRRRGERTQLTFPDGSKCTVECTGVGHVVASTDAALRSVRTPSGDLIVLPVDDDWPVCVISTAEDRHGSYVFDAPHDVKIHRDDIKVIK